MLYPPKFSHYSKPWQANEITLNHQKGTQLNAFKLKLPDVEYKRGMRRRMGTEPVENAKSPGLREAEAKAQNALENELLTLGKWKFARKYCDPSQLRIAENEVLKGEDDF